MHKKHLAILLGTIAYGLLFYSQNAGVNFLLFTLLLCILLLVMDPNRRKNKTWLLFAFLSLCSSVFILMYGSTIAITANCISLLLLSTNSEKTGSSIPVNLINSFYSIAGTVVFIVIHLSRRQKLNPMQTGQVTVKLLIYTFAFIFTIIFLSIYRAINPLFEKYTSFLSLNFISLEWILFTLLGFPLLYGLILNRRIKPIDDWEGRLNHVENPAMPQPFNINVMRALLFLFIALNAMLILINALDIYYLHFGAGMPEGLTHKQFVHNGVGMLMLSILLGTAIILASFEKSQNFDPANKLLKLMIYGWLLQNIFMITSTCVRNNLYIHEALLTYKRIGVYFWLFMAGILLLSTFYKLRNIWTAWRLLKINSFSTLLLLVGSASVDWDKLISDHNISRVKYLASLDKKYLVSLSETNVGSLYSLKNLPGFTIDSVYHYQYSKNYPNKAALDSKLYNFLRKTHGKDWRSFNFREKRISSEIKALDSKRIIDTLNLTMSHVSDLEPLHGLHFSVLKLGYSFSFNDSLVKKFNRFKNINSLYYESWSARDTVHFAKLTNLQTLCLYYSGSKRDSMVLINWSKKRPFRLVLL